MRVEVVQADVVTRRSPGMDAFFHGPTGVAYVPGPARCHVVAILVAPGFLGNVKIPLELN